MALFKYFNIMQDQPLLPQNEADVPISSPLEKLLMKVNGEGKFQFISFMIFNFQWFLMSWLLLGMSFFFDPDFTCDGIDDSKKCLDFVCSFPPQQRGQHISSHPSSIVFAFQNQFMICSDLEYKATVLQSMLFFGSLAGFFVIPYIADNSGRRLAMRIAWGLGTIGVFIVEISDSSNMVAFGLFMAGFGFNPAITLCYSFINQQCLGKSRQMYGVGIQIALGFGESTIALIFLTGLTWRQIMLLLLCLCVIGNGFLLYLLETPMFLMKKSFQQTVEVLNKIAKINKRPLITVEEAQQLKIHEQKEEDDDDDISAKQNRTSIIDLFRYPSLRWISISSGMVFLGIQTIYYSTSLNLGSAGFSKLINQEIIGISEMAGYIGAEFIIATCYRKKTTFIGLGISTLMCGVLAILINFKTADNETMFNWLQTVGLIINRFVLCGFWSIFFVYVAELFPTKVRSLGYGWTSVVGMIGSTISPYILLVSDSIGINSWYAPTIIGFIAWMFIKCLPQTHGATLKVDIDERSEEFTVNQDSQSSQHLNQNQHQPISINPS